MTRRRISLGCVCVAGLAAPVAAQLREPQVLVVYDSRLPDSLAVAEYYAGSDKVPGGVGSLPGKRPGVRVCNLQSVGGNAPWPGDMTYTEFKARVRDPLRTFLTTSGLATKVRCIVLTKGLPHRILDINQGSVGDNPGNQNTIFSANNATNASVDSELTLLWQNLDANEANGAADSKADGAVQNPYWGNTQSILAYPSANVAATKTFTQANATGPLWNATTGAASARLTPGDIYLVVRLDAKTVPQAQAMIDRAQGFVSGVTAQAILLDKDSGNFDAAASPWTAVHNGNDYSNANTALVNDGRFRSTSTPTVAAPGVNFNNNTASGAQNFYAGPLITLAAGQGVLVNLPVVYLASYGSNHFTTGIPTLAAGGTFGTEYAKSFNYANGAIFNSLESYNGRDFGGVGGNPSVPQEQLSDFIEGGGTFGVGNVWEPFTLSLADNEYLVKNFVLGGLSWAEAAYTALPVLSWQQIVVGDPLARFSRSTEDINADGIVNLDDLYALDQLPAADARRDVNRDGTINAADRALLLKTTLRATERAELISGRP